MFKVNKFDDASPLFLTVLLDIAPVLHSRRLKGKVRPDSALFKLHYRLTFALLLVSTVVVSTYEYIDKEGSAIQCMVDEDVGVDVEVINKYCFISSTFTLPRHFEGQEGEDFTTYGVGYEEEGDERLYHAYYQWVPFLLIFQACCFYAPHFVWKNVEAGRTQALVKEVKSFVACSTLRAHRVESLARFLCGRMLDKENDYDNRWHFNFVMCEALNIVNVVVQMAITDKFLGNVFLTFGLDVLWFPSSDPSSRVDPMSLVFPRMAKCQFHKFGPSGTLERVDALCVLPMNIVHEKLFLFLYFYFLLLLFLSCILMALRLMEVRGSHRTRRRLLALRSHAVFDAQFPHEDIARVVRDMRHGHFFLLKAISKVVERNTFNHIVAKMADLLREKDMARSKATSGCAEQA